MYSIHTRDDLEKLKNLQETKYLLRKERLKEKLGKQDFHYDMEEVFEPVTENQIQIQTQNQTKQQELSEKQIQALRDSTQTTTQAIENQTRAIEHSSDILNKNLQKSIKEGRQEYDEITNRNNEILKNLVNSNKVDSNIIKTVSNLLNTKSQFSLKLIEGYSKLFIINPHNPQQVLIKGSTMIFQNGHSYDLNHPDLQYFISNTHLDRQIKNWDPIYNFLNDMKYDLNYGVKKSIRYQFIKELYSRYQLQEPPQFKLDNTQGSHLGSGLRQHLQGSARELSQSCAQSYTQGSAGPIAQGSTQQFVFLPSDPDELVYQLKLLYFEILGGNDSFLIIEQIFAITDKLLEYECITPSQHQNIRSSTQSNHLSCNV